MFEFISQFSINKSGSLEKTTLDLANHISSERNSNDDDVVVAVVVNVVVVNVVVQKREIPDFKFGHFFPLASDSLFCFFSPQSGHQDWNYWNISLMSLQLEVRKWRTWEGKNPLAPSSSIEQRLMIESPFEFTLTTIVFLISLWQQFIAQTIRSFCWQKCDQIWRNFATLAQF